MSAALVDEFSFDGYRVPATRTQRGGLRPVAAPRPATAPRRSAPGDHGVPIVPPASSSLRLTERGVAVMLTLFAGLFLAGVAMLIGGFLAVSDAPVQAGVGAASGVVRTVAG